MNNEKLDQNENSSDSSSKCCKNSSDDLKQDSIPSTTSYQNTTFLSKLTFWWIGSWIERVQKFKGFSSTDLPPNIPQADSAFLNQRYDAYIAKCAMLKIPPTIQQMIIELFFWDYVEICIFQLMETVFKIFGCLVTIKFCKTFGEGRLISFILGFTSAIMLIINSAVHHQVFFRGARLGMLARITITTAIYKKLMRLTIANDSAAGQIVNMVSNDIQKIEDYCSFHHFQWFAPIETVLVCGVVWSVTKSAFLSFIVLLFVLLLCSFQIFLSFKFTQLRNKMVATRDEMIRYVTDLFTGIQVIKYYAWEDPFLQKINLIRSKVNEFLDGTALLKAINSILYFVSNDSLTTIFIAYFVFSSQSNISAIELLSVRQLFSVVVLVVCCFLPRSIELRSEAHVSVRRIEEFMSKADIEVRDEVGDPNLLAETSSELVMKNASFKWPGESFLPVNDSSVSLEDDSVPDNTPIALRNLNLTLKKGDLCLVVGAVGSGKSAFLNAILREIELVSGKFSLRGSISYVSQNPWLMNRSIRDNIVMGTTFNAALYAQVVEAAALSRDLSLMPNGDRTVVGERGSALSGGQRARISLARALYYQDANIFLLDDVLSAVDTVVGNLLVQGIKRMLRDKVCILVTHQLQFVKASSKVVLFEDGAMAFCGSYKELIHSDNLTFVETLKEYDGIECDDSDEPNSHVQDSMEEQGRNHGTEPLSVTNILNRQSDSPPITPQVHSTYSQESSDYSSSTSVELPNNFPLTDILDDSLEKESPAAPFVSENCIGSEAQNVTSLDEEKDTGSTGFKIYFDFFHSDNLFLIAVFLVFLSFIAQYLLVRFQDYVTGYIESSSFPFPRTSFHFTLMLLACEVLVFFTSIYFFYLISLRCAKSLFQHMLRSCIRSPMHFFQRNPLGRILNRFSKDQTTLDEHLYVQLSDAIMLTFRTIFCFGAVVFVQFRWENLTLFVMIPAVGFVVWWRSKRFFGVSRDLKRLEAQSRSPLYAHLSTTLEGLPLIRCFGVERIFVDDFFHLLNSNSRCLFCFVAVSRWYSFSVDFSCCFFFIAYMLLTVALSSSTSEQTIAAVAQSIGYCQEIAELVQWTARLIADVANSMTNVERIIDYANLESEAARCLPNDAKLPVGWPAQGNIQFNHMSIQYKGQSKPALSNITCNFNSGEKVALVGRTGAGKSSFLSALFRIVEPTPCPGAIVIDGIDISRIGLSTLRQRFSIIPQDPFLFKGDVRFNLDPFDQHTDSELWSALAAVQLERKITRMPGNLSAAVLENGQNFSVGQRQLLCLARAILRKRQVIVMDEATANIDLATSQLIQRTIKRIFPHNNLCTIAHRLHTVIDYDRIMVLDAGRIVEFDTPYALLMREDGVFASMVRELGPDGEATLKQAARDCWESKSLSD